LDSDDFCLPTRLEEQAAFLESHPDVDVVGCELLLISDSDEDLGIRRYPTDHAAIRGTFITSNGLAGPGVMLRRRILSQVGLFNPTLDRAEDLEYWLRCLRAGVVFHNLPRALLGYRTPTRQFAKRDRRHWKSNFISRARHSWLIWPIHKAFVSIAISFALYITPAQLYDLLFDHRLADRYRGVSK
jgi:hypothetical protein